jgi:glucose/arabinose dehydrogenase
MNVTRRRRSWWMVALATLIIALLVPATAVSAAPAMKLVRITGGFVDPTQVTNAGDGRNRLFVVEQRGTIRMYHSGAIQPGYFLDIRSKVSTGGERGLLGLAFHPDFETNRRFFVYYTRTDGDIVVSRFTANAAGTAASASTAEPLLLIEHSAQTNHNGGAMAFGPDGYLYIGVGDGGGSGDPEGDSRSITRNFLGKILRIDVNGSGAGTFGRYSNPPGNPYLGATRGLDPIWAYGLRNPWRISFDRATGALWIADVGQGRREEINRQSPTAKPGRDYGWNIMEGSTCYRPSACPLAGDTLPVSQYSHSSGNCSITGGYVYRGTRHPSLAGRYVFADFCSGRIWSIPSTGTGYAPSIGIDTTLNITSFGEQESGELYLVSRDGALYRIET